MINKRTIKLYREFKSLKKNKHLFTGEQYVNELEKILDDLNADIDAPQLSETEIDTFLKLITNRVK
ncbi:hypothetical protein [Flagellimonas sp.]|uniref:hypothetical protein n=1 Tax=Flagellimonas sp. TaxID=2058762 RepID=UPI003BAB79E9